MVKIYCDSRNRVSGTNEDFVWQIPETLDLSDSLVYIDCVLVPNVFWTVRAGYNDKIRFIDNLVSSSSVLAREATIEAGQYNIITLADAVQTALRAATGLTPTDIIVEPDHAKSKLKIRCTAAGGDGIEIYPDGLLTEGVANWNSIQASLGGTFPVDPANTQSAGKVCGFMGDGLIEVTASADAFGDSVVDVQKHHCLYVHSDLCQPGSVYGSRGENDVIRRVVIDVPQNSIAVDRHATVNDSVDVGARTLRSMSFRLSGADGETVDLRGHHWSFSLIFIEKM